MQLYFASDLNVGVANNALLTTSKECRDNYCGSGGATRYLTSGFASIDPISNVPELASWALMIAGFRRAKARKVSFDA